MQLRLCSNCARTFPPDVLKRGRCFNCRQERERERTLREPNHRAYMSTRWRKLVRVVRAREGGRCRYAGDECRGRLEVHHVVPARASSELFFDLSNLELVCRAHHEIREREAKAVF
jgi:hypothetical protein